MGTAVVHETALETGARAAARLRSLLQHAHALAPASQQRRATKTSKPTPDHNDFGCFHDAIASF
jgi:hypothetical protein